MMMMKKTEHSVRDEEKNHGNFKHFSSCLCVNDHDDDADERVRLCVLLMFPVCSPLGRFLSPERRERASVKKFIPKSFSSLELAEAWKIVGKTFSRSYHT